MIRRALPRVVLMSSVGPSKMSILRGGWRSHQLAAFLAEADALDLRFRGFQPSSSPSDGRSDVILAFDRWNTDFVRHTWPVLQQLDGSFAVVVETAGVGQRRRHLLGDGNATPAWSQLRELTRLGVDVVSGGHECYDLTALKSEVVYGELLRSRCEIERRLSMSPKALRYPFGRVDSRVARVAQDAGFEFGISGRGGSREDALRCAVMGPRPFEGPAHFARRVARDVEDFRPTDAVVAEAKG